MKAAPLRSGLKRCRGGSESVQMSTGLGGDRVWLSVGQIETMVTGVGEQTAVMSWGSLVMTTMSPVFSR